MAAVRKQVNKQSVFHPRAKSLLNPKLLRTTIAVLSYERSTSEVTAQRDDLSGTNIPSVKLLKDVAISLNGHLRYSVNQQSGSD